MGVDVLKGPLSPTLQRHIRLLITIYLDTHGSEFLKEFLHASEADLVVVDMGFK